MSSVPRTSPWSDLPRRLTTICIGVPVLWLWWWNDTRRWLFFQGVHAIMAWEWVHMTRMPRLWKIAFPMVSLTLASVSDASLFVALLPLVVALVCVTTGTPSTSTSSKNSTTVVSSHLLDVVVGLLLLSIPHRSWSWVSQHSFYDTIALLLTVWNGDTGALVAGRCLPYTSFASLQAISPKKSVAGLLGGVVGAASTYLVMPWMYTTLLAPNGWCPTLDLANRTDGSSFFEHVIMALSLGVLAVLGDLWESSLKRRYRVQDSGSWLPGHGGILDRFDSSLLAVVLYHYYLYH
jgi:phosphatidate cytidylyltransferase